MKKIFYNKNLKLYKLEIALIMTGVVILLISGLFENYQEEGDKLQNYTDENRSLAVQNADKMDYSEKYECQIEKILSQIDGIGSVSAAVYVKSDGVVSPAYNIDADNSTIEEKDADGATAKEQKKINTNSVVVIKDAQGNESVFCVGNIAPEIEGIAVSVKGGVNNVLKEKIIKTLMALYGISSSKISIIG